MTKKLGKIPQHKKMAITGNIKKKGEAGTGSGPAMFKKGGMVKKKGCK